ncbi:uncharacterized protein [Miscanthus floridulus]|uniref:uncharacterized protein n=1 Tax=Miscanthus floridulus TaxID=154761 RepID=UPI00345AC960
MAARRAQAGGRACVQRLGEVARQPASQRSARGAPEKTASSVPYLFVECTGLCRGSRIGKKEVTGHGGGRLRRCPTGGSTSASAGSTSCAPQHGVPAGLGAVRQTRWAGARRGWLSRARRRRAGPWEAGRRAAAVQIGSMLYLSIDAHIAIQSKLKYCPSRGNGLMFRASSTLWPAVMYLMRKLEFEWSPQVMGWSMSSEPVLQWYIYLIRFCTNQRVRYLSV